MRTSAVLLRKKYRLGRRPPQEPIPFKESFPLIIKNEVAVKGHKVGETACLQEMAVMFACMKKNDFKEVKCSQEINTFMSCYNQYQVQKADAKRKKETGEMTLGRNPRDLTSTQLNHLLGKYPQFNDKL